MGKRKITDAELLNTELIVSDPYALGGLELTKLPNDVQIIHAINMHRFERYPDEKVYCCKCNSRLHKNGYRVLRSDDLETLLGCCCAKPLLDRSWREAERGFKERQERQNYVRELHSLAPLALRAMPLLPTWDDLARRIAETRGQFFNAMPEAYELIFQAANRDGVLFATRRVRKLRWETSRDRDDDKADDKDDYRWDYVPVRHILAGRAFLMNCKPTALPDALREAIHAFVAVAEDTDRHGAAVLKRTCLRLRRALDDLLKLQEIRDAATYFFSDQNLEGIVHWARLLREGHDRQLRHELGWERGALINIGTGTRVALAQLPGPEMLAVTLLTYRKAA